MSTSTHQTREVHRARRSMLRNNGRSRPSPIAVDESNGPRAGPPAESGTETGEEIDDDDTCPICQLMLHNPVKTTCNHNLCHFCMATWASTSLAAPMTIVDVDEEPIPFDPVADLQARCPMCRTLTSARPNPHHARELEAKYPATWAQRQAEAEVEGTSESSEGIQTMTVYIGNRHQQVPPEDDDLDENQHDWTFFVKPSSPALVEEIHIHLHPTFRQNHIIRTRPPYQISRLGWGWFTITASVILKAGYSWVSDDAEDSPDGAKKGMLPLEWTLDFQGFDGKGSMGRCRLKVKHDNGDQVGVDAEEERDEREWRRLRRQYERDGIYQPPEDA